MRGKWDTIQPAPGPRKPITEGIRVGTIRSRYTKIAPTYKVACEHCGHEADRTEWQTLNAFHCYECSKDSKGKPELAETHAEPV